MTHDGDPAEQREKLESRKLRLEIRELRAMRRRTWATIFSSALTPLSAAILGLFVSIAAQRIGDQQHDADLYARLGQDLGSSNAPTRAGAIVGLTRFAISDPTRSGQTITLLVTQLTVESDSRVLRVLVPSLASVGLPALEQVVRENRSAAHSWIGSVQRYVTLSMPEMDGVSKIALGSRFHAVVNNARDAYLSLSTELGSYVDDMLLDRSEEFAVHNLSDLHILGLGNQNITFTQNQLAEELLLLAQGDDGTFGASESRFQGIPIRISASLAAKRTRERAQYKNAALNAARALFGTSLVLGRILRASSGNTANVDASEAVLLAADFDNATLSGTALTSAFLGGSARGANLSNANLSGARVLLRLQGANLTYASVQGASLPDTSDAANWRETYLGSSNLTGVDWWESRTVQPFGPIAVGFENNGKRCLYAPRSAEEATRLERGPSAVSGAATNGRWLIAHFPSASDRMAISLNIAHFQAAFPRAENESRRKSWLASLPSTGEWESIGSYYEIASSACF